MITHQLSAALLLAAVVSHNCRQKKRSRLLRIQDRTPEDEYNLVYVAATRARIALICNKDVQKLLEEADERLAVVKVCDGCLAFIHAESNPRNLWCTLTA